MEFLHVKGLDGQGHSYPSDQEELGEIYIPAIGTVTVNTEWIKEPTVLRGIERGEIEAKKKEGLSEDSHIDIPRELTRNLNEVYQRLAETLTTGEWDNDIYDKIVMTEAREGQYSDAQIAEFVHDDLIPFLRLTLFLEKKKQNREKVLSLVRSRLEELESRP